MAFGRNVKVIVDESGNVTTDVNAIGGLKSVTDPITTIFEPDTALTGTAKYVQLGAAAVLGNMLGVWATTGDLGVAATSNLKFTFGAKKPAANYVATPYFNG